MELLWSCCCGVVVVVELLLSCCRVVESVLFAFLPCFAVLCRALLLRIVVAGCWSLFGHEKCRSSTAVVETAAGVVSEVTAESCFVATSCACGCWFCAAGAIFEVEADGCWCSEQV